jgi:hypothetical protein
MQKKTQHYIFEFQPGTEAEKDIDLICATQEKAFEKITSFIGESDFPIIKYYLYSDRQKKGELTGNDGNGHAVSVKFEVHAIYNENILCIGPHEDTHLLTKNIGLPPQLFREGLAEYFSENWHGQPHSFWVKQFQRENKLFPISKLMDNEFWYEADDLISYPQAGSFISFLISEIGKEKFLELYKKLDSEDINQNNEKLMRTITGKSLLEWEKNWLSDMKIHNELLKL